MVSNNTVLIVIIVASLIGASDAWIWQPDAGIQFFSLFIFPIACAIGLGHYVWECKKRLCKK